MIVLNLHFSPTTFFEVRAILNWYLLVVTILKIIEAILSRLFHRQRWSGVYCCQGENLNLAECLVVWNLWGARCSWVWHRTRSWEWIVKVDWGLDQEAQKAVLRVGNGEPLEVLNTNHMFRSMCHIRPFLTWCSFTPPAFFPTHVCRYSMLWGALECATYALFSVSRQHTGQS